MLFKKKFLNECLNIRKTLQTVCKTKFSFRVLEKLFLRNETIGIINNFITSESEEKLFVYALKDSSKPYFEISDLEITENFQDLCVSSKIIFVKFLV